MGKVAEFDGVEEWRGGGRGERGIILDLEREQVEGGRGRGGAMKWRGRGGGMEGEKRMCGVGEERRKAKRMIDNGERKRMWRR